MALDGRGYLSGTHHWTPSQPGPLEYGFEEDEVMETDLVVDLYAGSSDSAGNAEAYEDKDAGLRCAYAYSG
jgi:hypothetical protein